jgi:hypothetical protein
VRLRLIASFVFAIAATLAQAEPLAPVVGQAGNNTTILPVLSTENGEIAALLLIEPSALPPLPSQRIIDPVPSGRAVPSGNGLQLRAGLSMHANPGLGVLCNNGGVLTSVGSMAGHCLLTDFSAPAHALPGRTAAKGLVQVQRGNSRLTASLGAQTDSLGNPSDLIGGTPADLRLLNTLLGSGSLNQQNASLVGQVKLGSQGWVSIGGTLARVRLIPTDQLPGGLPSEWNTSHLNLSGGAGNFTGEITGQMIEVPGQTNRYSTLGAGVTWRTPWRAKLSVGADNLVTRGKNPFGLPDVSNTSAEEGRVPYVRYQQDL